MNIYDLSSTRPYVFALHGAHGHYLRRQRRRRQHKQPVAAAMLELALDKIIAPENLLRVYRRLKATGGQAPGIDGITYGDISITEMAAALRKFESGFKNFCYRPQPTRKVLVPKPDGRTRELRIGTLVDRTVAAAMAEAITPVLDREFLPGSYGFRPGRSLWQMLAMMERTMVERGRWWLAVDDIKDAFPSARIADVTHAVGQYITDEQVLGLIETIARGSDGNKRTLGLDQGSPLSPVLLNVLLQVVLDRPFTADPTNPPWFRYADNLVYLCPGVSEGRQAIQRASQLLATAGFQLKGHDGPPVNLQRHGAWVKLLGFHVSRENDRLRFKIDHARWKGLAQQLVKAHEANNPVAIARAAVRGWLEANGPALESAEVAGVLHRIQGIAAQTGSRELGSGSGWEAAARAAHEQWVSVRGRAYRNDLSP